MHDPFLPPLSLTSALRPMATRLHLKTFPLHAHEVLLSWATYSLLSTLAPLISRILLPKTYPSWSPRTRMSWNGRLVSFIQSAFISTLAICVIWGDKERAGMDWRGRIWGYTGAGGLVQGCALGYFLWDVVVSVRDLDVFGVGSLVHAGSALVVSLLGFRPFANYYGLNFILYSVSTPFLTLHWLFDKLHMTGSTAQLVNGIALLTTFFFSRVVWGNYQSFLIYQDIWTALHSADTAVGDSPLFDYADVGERGRPQLPMWLVVLYLGSNTVLNFLNVYWFGKMVRTVRKRFAPRGEGAEIEKEERKKKR